MTPVHRPAGRAAGLVLAVTIASAAAAATQEAAPSAAPPPAAPPADAPPAAKKRSVLFYLIDTCRADRLSANGYERPTTPFLEELAARGVRFANCFSQAPWTKPSVSSILTSCYPTVTGMHQILDQLSNDFVTLPESLKQAGWYTNGFSANPIMGRMSNYAQGFRRFMDATQVIPNGDCIKYASGSSKALNRHVLPWVAQNQEWPFFLYVHSVDPHEEYRPEPEYLALFGDVSKDEEYRRQWQALLDTKELKIGNYCTEEHFSKAQVEIGPFIAHGRDLYDANVRANDDEIARLIDALRDRGQLDDMIVVVTADHGEEFMEHGGTSHGYLLFNELIHVPLMILAPGLLPEGLVVEEPVQSVDIYPTLLEMLGLPAPEGLQGTSFAPLLRGEPGPGRLVFSENHAVPGAEQVGLDSGTTLSVIEGRWKYILNLKSPSTRPRPRHELYRLDQDFRELANLAEQDPERVARYEALVLDWWTKNRARRSGVDVTSLTADELHDLDPETLERLRQLGYVR